MKTRRKPKHRGTRIATMALATIGPLSTSYWAATGCAKPDAHVKDTAAREGQNPVSALQRELASMAPASALPPSDQQKRLAAALEQHFRAHPSLRHYLHLDKPLYQPGESIWFRVFELQTNTLMARAENSGMTVSLINPRGAVVRQKRLQGQAGVTTNDFIVPEEAEGGEYTLRVQSDRGDSWERSVIISQYQPPRIKQTAEFVRKGYGPGDTVAAAVSLGRATGEALANHRAEALVVVDQVEIKRVAFTTDKSGNALVKFELPASFARGDGLMTILVNDGGVTESLQKRIPIVMKTVALQLFPEGGQLVEDLPGRVYFLAQNTIGKPADISGRVMDDTGAEVTTFASLHNGMGRFDLTPRKGRSYKVEITKPSTVKQTMDVPAALTQGCTVQPVDNVAPKASDNDDLRIGVFCSADREVIVAAHLRENKLGEQLVAVRAGRPSVAQLPVPRGSQGAVRVTLFGDDLTPLAERLLYRGRGGDLQVAVRADKKSYSPRDPVTLTVETKDSAGRPVAADLSLAVVDDTVLSFADDKTAHLLARLYLEAEMPGQKIEEPNFYFSDDPKAAPALDLVLGTQGWRRFDWQQLIAPTPTPATTTKASIDDMAAEPPMAAPQPQAEPEKKRAPLAKAEERQAKDRPMPAVVAPKQKVAAQKPMARRDRREEGFAARGALADAAEVAAADKEFGNWAGNMDEDMDMRMVWAPIRVFPAPNYQADYDGPRVDFRETIHWEPSVKTDTSGVAKVSFFVSDAVTSFRATAEGVSAGGLPGRGGALVTSKLPVSLAVKMPLEVSAGDTVRLPITLENETDREHRVAITSEFGRAYKVKGGVPKAVTLAKRQRQSFFAELEVVGSGADAADGKMRVSMETSNLRDEVSREIRVVPLGFPKEVSLAGTVKERAEHTVNLAGALPGSIEANLTLYPSPLATMMKGTEGLLLEPSGCFEQASSTNYPNIMILSYLEQHDSVNPELVTRTQGLLDRGYKKLIGYESPKKGYEWFGGDPGHEALTAYGLLEFADMNKVYGDVDRSMLNRTADWLKSRRDGKGGYKKNSRALDSFGRASDEVTAAYITYALTEAGYLDLKTEIAAQAKLAATTKDPYVLALAINTVINADPQSAASSAQAALKRLAAMQSKEGSWASADHSITRSGGQALVVETTALATRALIKAGPVFQPQVRAGIEWLNKSRSGHGNFSSTQATILALQAMTDYAAASRKTESSGTVYLVVNGKQVGQLAFAKDHADPLVFDDISAVLAEGENKIELRLDSKTSLPYSMAISYRSQKPASDENAKVRIHTEMGKTTVPMGEGVRVDVSVENTTNEGIPMTLARVGIPGGLTFQTWQLKELKDKKVIDFYETREREVVLYFRSMAPRAKQDIPLELIARVPGVYTAPASRAYLYYTDESKDWVDPLGITVTK